MATVVTDIGYKRLISQISDKRAELAYMVEQVKEMSANILSTEDSSEINDSLMTLDYLRSKLNELETLKFNARVIDVSLIPTNKVYFGSIVTIENTKSKENFVYRLVSELESDPVKGLLSYTSPLGALLLKEEVGEVIELTMGNMVKEFEIIHICSEPLKDTEY